MNDNPGDNPYKILSVSSDASQSEIKAAYRKLALKYHPDRQNSVEEKEKSAEIFQRIGNAYEIIGDKERREDYDRYGNTPQKQHQSRDDPFSMFRGFRTSSRGFGNDRFQTGGFTDPFNLFHEVFRNDRGQGFGFDRMDETNDSFFPSNDDGFGRSVDDMMSRHMSMMNSMMGMRNPFESHHHNSAGRAADHFSTSSLHQNSQARRVGEQTSTRTTIINGKRQTVTEKIIYNPDGTVERKVETSGDEDFPTLQSFPAKKMLKDSDRKQNNRSNRSDR